MTHHFSQRLRDVRAFEFPVLNAYWSDRRERARIDAEIAHSRALVQAAIDAGMAPINERQRAAWAMEKHND